MLNQIYEYLLNRPALMRLAARLVWLAGCFALLAGVFAQAVNVLLSLATSRASGSDASYEQLLPGIPTWWIPESAAGVAFYLTLMLAAYASTSSRESCSGC